MSDGFRRSVLVRGDNRMKLQFIATDKEGCRQLARLELRLMNQTHGGRGRCWCCRHRRRWTLLFRRSMLKELDQVVLALLLMLLLLRRVGVRKKLLVDEKREIVIQRYQSSFLFFVRRFLFNLHVVRRMHQIRLR